MSKWIPVTERLPESGVPVLVTGRNYCDKRVWVDVDVYYKAPNQWDRAYDEVLAWMPLPEPYAERKDE